jgi:hypothetical protein
MASGFDTMLVLVIDLAAAACVLYLVLRAERS